MRRMLAVADTTDRETEIRQLAPVECVVRIARAPESVSLFSKAKGMTDLCTDLF